MDKKRLLKIACILVSGVALLASCAKSADVEVHAVDEETDSEKWLEYSALLADILVDISSKPTTAQSVALGIQYMIAVTESVNTADDATLYNRCASIMYCYDFQSSVGQTTYHVNNLVGSPYKRYESSDGIVTHTFDTYPNGTSVQGIFSASDSTMTVQNNGGNFSIIGNPQYRMYWTAPFNQTGGTLPFTITTSGTVTKLEDHLAGSSVLGLSLGAVLGGSITTQPSEPSTTYHLPKATTGQTTNDFLPIIYQFYEDEFEVPFAYNFPDALPDGLILPDGSLTGGEQDATGDININVEVEFPTYNVPDYPEPDTFPLETIPDITEHETSEISEDAFLGFDFWWNCTIILLSLFDVWDLVILILWVGLICFLLWR